MCLLPAALAVDAAGAASSGQHACGLGQRVVELGQDSRAVQDIIRFLLGC